MNIGSLIGSFIVVVVGLLLAPMVGSYVATAKADENLSDISGLTGLLDLVPFMWIIAIIGIAVALGYKAFKED